MLTQFLQLLFGQFPLGDTNDDLLDRAVEVERYMIVFTHRSTGVFPNVEGLVQGHAVTDSALQSLGVDDLPIDAERCLTAGPDSPILIVLEVQLIKV